jgi:NADH dehydrogenase
MVVTNRPNIVIVGAGFGGLFTAKGLLGAEANVTLIDKQNHHLFQPLLYQVAAGFLAISDVAVPIRSLFHREDNVEVVMSEVTNIDNEQKLVHAGGRSYPYDHLVLATGAKYHFFGRDEWAPHVQVLKTISDAIGLRQSVLTSFELAEAETNEEKRKRLLTYVVIGGGPTGVEMAGAIAELVNYALEKEFRHIDAKDVRIVLIEASPYLLGVMGPKLSEYTKKALIKMGVDVRTDTSVEDITAKCVHIKDGKIESDMILWAAGVKPLPAGEWIGAPMDKRGGIEVNADLTVQGMDNVYALGDVSTLIQGRRPLPGLASVAKQQGKYLAQLLKARVKGEEFNKNFSYRDYGTMAIIGRHAAVADFRWIKFKGRFAAFLWGFAHIYFLMGFRNRAAVFVTWLWTFFTLGIGARVILSKKRNGEEME